MYTHSTDCILINRAYIIELSTSKNNNCGKWKAHLFYFVIKLFVRDHSRYNFLYVLHVTTYIYIYIRSLAFLAAPLFAPYIYLPFYFSTSSPPVHVLLSVSDNSRTSLVLSSMCIVLLNVALSYTRSCRLRMFRYLLSLLMIAPPRILMRESRISISP